MSVWYRPSLMSKGTSLDSTMNYSIAVNIHYVNIKALTSATVSELSRCDANGFAGLLRKKGEKKSSLSRCMEDLIWSSAHTCCCVFVSFHVFGTYICQMYIFFFFCTRMFWSLINKKRSVTSSDCNDTACSYTVHTTFLFFNKINIYNMIWNT